MPSQKAISVKAARRVIHGRLRLTAAKIVHTITVIENTERLSSLPANPYREMLGAVEEYYNQLADEFDDPVSSEPARKSLEEAHAVVRDLHRAACNDPLAPFGGAKKASSAGLRNAGGNADSAGDLLEDAIGMLVAVQNRPKAVVTLGEYEQAVKDVIGVLRQLEPLDMAKGALGEKEKCPKCGLAECVGNCEE